MGLKRGRGDVVPAHATFRKTLGAPSLVPPKFKRQIKTTQIAQDAEADYLFPAGLEGNEILVDLKQDPRSTTTASLVTIEEELLTTNALRSYRRDKDALIETLDENLVNETDPPPALNEFVTTEEQEALGDGRSIRRVGTVPIVFGGVLGETSIPGEVTPIEFRARLPSRIYANTAAGTADPDPDLQPGWFTRREEQVDAFRFRQSTTSRDLSVLPVTVIGSRTTKDKQVEHVLRTLEDDTTVPAVPTALLDVKFDELGDGTAVEEWDYVDTLFTQHSFAAEIPDTVPERFKAIVPVRKAAGLSVGTAAPPSLLTGELSHVVEQINAFVKHDATTYRDIGVLPVTLVGYKMTSEQQVATVDATLDTGIQDLTDIDELTVEASVDNLGNNTSLKTKADVDTLFPKDSYTKSILNLIPEKLRAAIPQTETTFDEPGAPSIDPTLLTGELSRTESRVTDFVRRIHVVKLGVLTLPVIVTDQGQTREFGGDTTTITHTLRLHGVLVVETGPRVLKSDVIDLGNGYDVRSTEKADNTPWPALRGQDYDQRLDVPIPFTQQTKNAGTGIGTARTQIKPLDMWRQENTSFDITEVAAVLDAYVLSYPTKVNVDMPDKLVSVTGIIESSLGEGASSETGSFAFVGNYSVSQDLRASAQSSATLIPDIIPGIKQFWGNNIPCKQYHFFLPNPVTPAQVITRLTALIGGPVLAWPKFNPEIVTMIATGEKASLQAVATSKGSAAVNDSSSSSTTGGGTGYSRERGLSLKTVRISPTIHAEINVAGDTTQSQDISATATAEATGLGPSETSDQTDTVVASVSPTVIPATLGATDWPATGIFLYRLDAQPYRFSYVQFQAIIVDAADFPNH